MQIPSKSLRRALATLDSELWYLFNSPSQPLPGPSSDPHLPGQPACLAPAAATGEDRPCSCFRPLVSRLFGVRPAGVKCGGTPQRQTDQTDVCGAPLQILTSFSHLFFPVCLVYFEPTKGTGPPGSFSGSVIPRSIDSMEVLIFLRIYFLFMFFFFFLVS